jgi:hypothetical protein
VRVSRLASGHHHQASGRDMCHSKRSPLEERVAHNHGICCTVQPGHQTLNHGLRVLPIDRPPWLVIARREDYIS